MRTIPFLIPAISFALPLVLVTPSPASEPEYEMTTYQFVLLRAVPDMPPAGERELVRIQEGHLAILQDLYDRGMALASGPLSGGGDLETALVLNTGSAEKAREILDRDPWITSGRRTAEIFTWWAAKGILQKPENILHGSHCVLGLLERPENARDYPEERLEEIQAGHLENIKSMAASGDLVIAGPMAEDGVLRGILVFRTTDTARLAGMVAKDPAVKAGRLGARLFPWRVPTGTIPQR